MTHSDDNGLVLPPKIAPKHVVLMPIYKSEEDKIKILDYVKNLAATIKIKTFAGSSIRVEVDNRDIRGGEKAWQHIKKGVPLRVEIGPKDLAAGTLFVGRRDFAPKQKFSVSHQDFIENLPKLLEEIQSNILERATKFRDENLKEVNSIEEFRTFFTPAKGGENELHGGFAAVHWNESAIDHPILSELKVSPRCIPLEWKKENGTCIFTGKKSDQRVIFAKNY
jgi:prolyl-tRNA synthetase